MFTKKDRKIANLNAMVKNRDKKILFELEEKRMLQNRVTGLLKLLYEIKKLSNLNTYNNPEEILKRINELAKKSVE